MIEFKKYSSIENHFYKDYLDQVREQVPANVQWVVQEKVHGTNTSFLCDGNDVKFAEKKSVKRRNKQLEQQVEYSKELTQMLGLLDLFVNENRFANVVSHIGEVQIPCDLGKLIKEMSYDVVEDFLKEHAALYNVIDKSEIKIFNKELNKKISFIVKSVYMTAH